MKEKNETIEETTKERNYELISLTQDFMFKNVFGKYGNEDILGKFLSAILNENVTKVVIQNGELIKPSKNKKMGILDIRAEIDEKELVDIEIQVENQYNLSERCMYYLCKLYSGQLNVSEKYTEIKKSIVIAIIDFDYYDRDEYHSIAHMKFEENQNENEIISSKNKRKQQELVTDKLEYHVINLKKFREKNETTGC